MSQQRLDLAADHEHETALRLEQAGWFPIPWGQGQLPEMARRMLGRTLSPIRWTPDLLAIRDTTAVFIDAKAGRSDTANYAIEAQALVSHRRLCRAGHPVVVVWHDFNWSHAWELHPDDGVRGAHNGNGSGTPFVLFRKVLAHPWDHLAAGRL